MSTAPATLRSIVLAALFFSGVASVANQVVWQRGLKIFLGGSETLSAMIVVLVFMAGLGLGAGAMGARAARFTNPMRAFAIVELALFAINVAIAQLLGSDVGASLAAFQRALFESGFPIRAFYAIGSVAILMPPTLLMGATLPIASEIFQRQLGEREQRLIVTLFLLNTLGAVVGAFGSSFLLLPLLGQWITLVLAATMNGTAGVLLYVTARSTLEVAPRAGEAPADATARPPLRFHEAAGLVLGLLSLGYEMTLLRWVPLLHEPQPTTFATTLCLYLLFWSFGVFLAGRVRVPLLPVLGILAALVAATPWFYTWDRIQGPSPLYALGLYYFLPCIAFGLLYGTLVSRHAESWGEDVGRFSLANTVGSCLGVLVFTLVGYELPHAWNAGLIVLGLVGLGSAFVVHDAPETESARRAPARVVLWGVLVAMLAVVSIGLQTRFTDEPFGRTYWGRDGVVEISKDGNVYLDGFWHTQLSDGKSHIGDRYTWMMAFSALFAHPDPAPERALVIGNGVGLTAATLARVPSLDIVAYEINHTLRDVLEDHPRASLGVDRHPRIDLRWQDARTGLALDTTRFDLIVSAPLLLRQAGSSLLLSTEYFELLSSRLEDDGVLAVYAHEGVPSQTLTVYQTLRAVFPHVVRLDDGRIAVASRSPISIDRARIQSRLSIRNPFFNEVGRLVAARRKAGKPLLPTLRSQVAVPIDDWPLITNDHPLAEYSWAIDYWAPGPPEASMQDEGA